MDGESNRYQGITTSFPEQNIKSAHFICSEDYIPHLFHSTGREPIIETARCVCVTDSSLLEGIETMVLIVPPGGQNNSLGHSVLVQQLSSSLQVCPKGKYIVHFTVKSGSADAFRDLSPVVEGLLRINEGDFSKKKPTALFQFFFSQGRNDVKDVTLPDGVWRCRSPNAFIVGFEEPVSEAENLFKKIYPEEEFFPLSDDPTVTSNEHSWEDDTSTIDSSAQRREVASQAPGVLEATVNPEEGNEKGLVV